MSKTSVRRAIAWALFASVAIAIPTAQAEPRVPLSALLKTTPDDQPVLGRRMAQKSDDPPRTPPIPRPDPRAEAEAAEKRRKQELENTPAYKRWWFWALSAAVVGGVTGLAIWSASGEDEGPRARSCPPGTLACFGDGR